MNRKELMKKIIYPVMDDKGFQLKRSTKGIWEWEKEVSGIPENVMITDVSGRVSLTIGKSRGNVEAGRAESLIETIENPRTTMWDWTYEGAHTTFKSKEELYENILLDYRDIIVKNCDEVLLKNAEKLKRVVPNQKHFQYMCENHTQLAKICREEMAIKGESVQQILGLVMEKIKELSRKPLEEVEFELVSYAAFLEDIVLEHYGGIRKVNYEQESIMISGVGKYKKSCNLLVDVFWMWEDNNRMDTLRREWDKFVS